MRAHKRRSWSNDRLILESRGGKHGESLRVLRKSKVFERGLAALARKHDHAATKVQAVARGGKIRKKGRHALAVTKAKRKVSIMSGKLAGVTAARAAHEAAAEATRRRKKKDLKKEQWREKTARKKAAAREEEAEEKKRARARAKARRRARPLPPARYIAAVGYMVASGKVNLFADASSYLKEAVEVCKAWASQEKCEFAQVLCKSHPGADEKSVATTLAGFYGIFTVGDALGAGRKGAMALATIGEGAGSTATTVQKHKQQDGAAFEEFVRHCVLDGGGPWIARLKLNTSDVVAELVKSGMVRASLLGKSRTNKAAAAAAATSTTPVNLARGVLFPGGGDSSVPMDRKALEQRVFDRASAILGHSALGALWKHDLLNEDEKHGAATTTTSTANSPTTSGSPIAAAAPHAVDSPFHDVPSAPPTHWSIPNRSDVPPDVAAAAAAAFASPMPSFFEAPAQQEHRPTRTRFKRRRDTKKTGSTSSSSSSSSTSSSSSSASSKAAAAAAAATKKAKGRGEEDLLHPSPWWERGGAGGAEHRIEAASGELLKALAGFADLDGVMALVDDADLSTRDKDGNTALHCACRRASAQIIAAVADRAGAAVVNMQNHAGDTALHCACRRGLAATRCVVRQGADWEVRNKAGKTPDEVVPATATSAHRLFVESAARLSRNSTHNRRARVARKAKRARRKSSLRAALLQQQKEEQEQQEQKSQKDGEGEGEGEGEGDADKAGSTMSMLQPSDGPKSCDEEDDDAVLLEQMRERQQQLSLTITAAAANEVVLSSPSGVVLPSSLAQIQIDEMGPTTRDPDATRIAMNDLRATVGVAAQSPSALLARFQRFQAELDSVVEAELEDLDLIRSAFEGSPFEVSAGAAPDDEPTTPPPPPPPIGGWEDEVLSSPLPPPPPEQGQDQEAGVQQAGTARKLQQALETCEMLANGVRVLSAALEASDYASVQPVGQGDHVVLPSRPQRRSTSPVNKKNRGGTLAQLRVEARQRIHRMHEILNAHAASSTSKALRGSPPPVPMYDEADDMRRTPTTLGPPPPMAPPRPGSMGTVDGATTTESTTSIGMPPAPLAKTAKKKQYKVDDTGTDAAPSLGVDDWHATEHAKAKNYAQKLLRRHRRLSKRLLMLQGKQQQGEEEDEVEEGGHTERSAVVGGGDENDEDRAALHTVRKRRERARMQLEMDLASLDRIHSQREKTAAKITALREAEANDAEAAAARQQVLASARRGSSAPSSSRGTPAPLERGTSDRIVAAESWFADAASWEHHRGQDRLARRHHQHDDAEQQASSTSLPPAPPARTHSLGNMRSVAKTAAEVDKGMDTFFISAMRRKSRHSSS